MELPSQLIGIELCSTSMSSTYTRKQRPTLLFGCIGSNGAPYNHSAARLRVAPLPFGSRPCPDFATLARKTVNLHRDSFDRSGNSSRHDDASCRRSSHMSPSSCSSSWSREQERPNSSAPRDCTNPNNVGAPRFPPVHKKRDVIGFPLLPLRGRLVICYHLV